MIATVMLFDRIRSKSLMALGLRALGALGLPRAGCMADRAIPDPPRRH